MNLKTSPFAIQDKKLRDLDLANEYPTLKDLMKEQGVSTDLADYWNKECELNPSNPRCLVYEDQLNSDECFEGVLMDILSNPAVF